MQGLLKTDCVTHAEMLAFSDVIRADRDQEPGRIPKSSNAS
jgi:hypothetical protein